MKRADREDSGSVEWPADPPRGRHEQNAQGDVVGQGLAPKEPTNGNLAQ